MKRRLPLLIKPAVALLALALILRFASRVGWSDLAARLLSADPLLTTVAVGLLLGRWAFWLLRWSGALHWVGDDSPTGRRLSVLLASILANHVIPSMRLAGGILRARYLSRSGPASAPALYGGVVYEMLVHHLVAALLTWSALVAVAWARIGPPAAAGLFASGVGLAALLATRLGGRRATGGSAATALLERVLGGRGRSIVARGRETLSVVRAMLADRRLTSSITLLSALFLLANIAAQWSIFAALGTDVGLLVVVVVIGLGGFAGIVTGTPGGVATTEAASIAGYVALGLGRAEAVAGVLLFRGLHYALVLGLGSPCLLYWELGRPIRPAPKPVPSGPPAGPAPGAPGELSASDRGG